MIRDSDKLIDECPNCHGPVVISHTFLNETKKLIRKAICPDNRCACITWQHMEMAKPVEKSYKLYCPICNQETQLLVCAIKGLACRPCVDKQRGEQSNG
jgi:hypothetical protein